MDTQTMGMLKLEQGTGTKSPLSLRFRIAFCCTGFVLLDSHNASTSLGTV